MARGPRCSGAAGGVHRTKVWTDCVRAPGNSGNLALTSLAAHWFLQSNRQSQPILVLDGDVSVLDGDVSEI